VATSVSAEQDSRKWAGLFEVSGEVREGHKPGDLEQGIYEVIDKLKQEDVPAEELQKVKNNIAAGEYRRLTSNFPILMYLILNDGEGDWHEINEAGAKLQAVTAADVKRVAQAYLTAENRTVALYTRKAGATPAQPDVGGKE
jgi:predicted Zn-dependent peptidase